MRKGHIYRGWIFEENGSGGWILMRRLPYQEKSVVRYSKTIKQGKSVIDDLELRIKMGFSIEKQ